MYNVKHTFNLFLNSDSRISGTISNCKLKMPSSVIYCDKLQKIRLTLIDFVLNYSHYNIQSYNNYFQIEETNPTNKYTVTINEGNYSVSEIAQLIKTELNKCSTKKYDVLYDRHMNRITFFYTGDGTVKFLFNTLTDTDDTLAEIMGFNYDTEYNFNLKSLTSIKVCSTGQEEALYVRFVNIPNNNYEAYGNEFKISSILAKIPLETIPCSNIFYHTTSKEYSMILSNNKLDEIEIHLTNEYGAILNLQREYTMTLQIEILEENNIESILNELKEQLSFLVIKDLEK